MNKSVLIVDDDDSIRRNYRDVLEDAGYCVAECDVTDDWQNTFNEKAFDLVMLDISINGDRYAGHKICKSIKSDYPDLLVVMLTSLDDEHHRAIAINNGADGYWIKSARLDKFLDDVRSISTERNDRHA